MNLLVIRDTANTNRDSTFALLKQIINKWCGVRTDELFSIRESDMRIKCINGNEVIFRGLDDPEKIKSVTFSNGELDTVWVEEASEIEEQAFQQLDVRLRGGKTQKTIFVTFNPVDIKHWLKKRFIDNPPDNSMVLKTTYKDNRFIDDEYIKTLEGFKNTDPYYYQVYCLGEFGVLGTSIFPQQIVQERINALRKLKPLKKGLFAFKYEDEKIVEDSITWIDDFETGYITIYEDVKHFYPYVIGGDTAGEGSDWFVGQVLKNTDGSQVAKLRHQFDEDLYARQMFCLGKYYNYALIGIEVNWSTYPTKELQRLGYYKQFMREVEDKVSKERVKSFGFLTNKLTRPVSIAELVKIVREKPELFNDVETLEEMLTFVRNEKKGGRPEAQKGAHDDMVMAIAIAHYIRSQQTMNVKSPTGTKSPIQKHKEKLARDKNRKRNKRFM